MCSDNPNLPKEANKAKCFAVACFIFSVFSMIGFAAGATGIVGACCGLLACIASSMLMCCAPKTTDAGACKFTAAGVLLVLAGIIQVIMGIVVIVTLIAALNAVEDDSYCNERYSKCQTALARSYSSACLEARTAGTTCTAVETCTDGLCYVDPDVDILDPAYATSTTPRCASKSEDEFCKSLNDVGKATITGIFVIFFGIAAFFLFIAGILNTIGGAYCFRAKSAIEAHARMPSPPVAVAVAKY